MPLYKGGDSTSVNNYRPISILNIYSQRYWRSMFVINYILMLKIIKSSMNCQFGCRHARSTSQAVVRHTGYIYEELDRDNIVFSLYIDFQKRLILLIMRYC